MNCVDISEPIKSCLWLTFLKFDVPIVILTLPMNVFTETRNINIENLVDVFDLHIVKASESIIKVVVYRNRLSEKPDDGYALKFDFTVTGFDEETQSAIMKHDDEKAGATFMLTENVLERIRSTHFVFDLFVVVKMLEFKSLNKNDPRKIRVDVLTRCEKVKLEEEEIEQLGFVLKNPELEDVLTGNYFYLISDTVYIVFFRKTKLLFDILNHCRKRRCLWLPFEGFLSTTLKLFLLALALSLN